MSEMPKLAAPAQSRRKQTSLSLQDRRSLRFASLSVGINDSEAGAVYPEPTASDLRSRSDVRNAQACGACTEPAQTNEFVAAGPEIPPLRFAQRRDKRLRGGGSL